MTGMKEGAGEDPFSDDEPVGSEPEPEPESESAEPAPQSASGQQAAMHIPYKFRRDGVQDGRERVPLFLHTESKRAERAALSDLEAHFDEDVALTDLREALVKVGLQHLDEVEGHLEGWGYGLTFDE